MKKFLSLVLIPLSIYSYCKPTKTTHVSKSDIGAGIGDTSIDYLRMSTILKAANGSMIDFYSDTIGTHSEKDFTLLVDSLSSRNLNNYNFWSCTYLGDFRLEAQKGTNFRLSFIYTMPPSLEVSSMTPNSIVYVSCEQQLPRRKKCKLYINMDNISRLDIDYRYFTMNVDYSESNSSEASFEKLLNNFKSKGELENYRLLDIDYQRYKIKVTSFGYFLWWIPEYWNNYGYNKEWVFGWTFLLVLIFTTINYFWFQRLNANVYNISNIPLFTKLSFGKRLWYSFFYTSIIFFKFSLKIENLNTKKVGGITYIMFIYTLGLICLAYMASFVLEK